MIRTISRLVLRSANAIIDLLTHDSYSLLFDYKIDRPATNRYQHFKNHLHSTSL